MWPGFIPLTVCFMYDTLADCRIRLHNSTHVSKTCSASFTHGETHLHTPFTAEPVLHFPPVMSHSSRFEVCLQIPWCQTVCKKLSTWLSSCCIGAKIHMPTHSPSSPFSTSHPWCSSPMTSQPFRFELCQQSPWVQSIYKSSHLSSAVVVFVSN